MYKSIQIPDGGSSLSVLMHRRWICAIPVSGCLATFDFIKHNAIKSKTTRQEQYYNCTRCIVQGQDYYWRQIMEKNRAKPETPSMCALLIGSLMSALERCSRLGQTKQCWSYMLWTKQSWSYIAMLDLQPTWARPNFWSYMDQTTHQLFRSMSMSFEHDSTF